MDFTTLLYTPDKGVATITLNRPDVLNALTSVMRNELRQAFEQAGADDDVRAVVLTGGGRGFCAGQDLRERTDAPTPGVGATVRQEYNPLILAMRQLPKPVIAAVNGVAAGAGCSLALACDLIVAAESATFLEAFVNIGLVPDSGSSFFLPYLVGYARAAEMAFLGERVPATGALEMGLINRVVPDGELQSAAQALAGRLAALPTKAIGQTKRQLNLALAATLEAVLEEEARGQEMATQTADHREGLQAFREKRPPKFSGR